MIDEHLYYYLQQGDFAKARALVAFGASVNKCNAMRQTPLDNAIMTNKNDIATLLKELGGVSGLELQHVNSGSSQQQQQQQDVDEGEDQMRVGNMGKEIRREFVLVLASWSSAAQHT